MQEALLSERGKLLEALRREEAHAAAVAAACSGASASADPAGDPGAAPAAPADAWRPAGDGAADAMAVDGEADEGAAEQGAGAEGGGAGQAPEGDAEGDALDAYMSSVRTQIELDKARPGPMRYTLTPAVSSTSQKFGHVRAHADLAGQDGPWLAHLHKTSQNLCISVPL